MKILGYPVIDRIVYIPTAGDKHLGPRLGVIIMQFLDIGFTVQIVTVQPYNVKMVVTLCAINNLPVV